MLNLTLEVVHWFLMAFLIMFFLLTIEIFNINNRKLKRTSRLITGLGIGVFFWGLLTVDFPVKWIGLIIASISYILFRLIRHFQPSTDLCLGCDELNAGKVCSGLETKAKAMNEYSDYASDLLQDVLRSKYQNKLDK